MTEQSQNEQDFTEALSKDVSSKHLSISPSAIVVGADKQDLEPSSHTQSRQMLSQTKALSAIASRALLSPNNELQHLVEKLESRIDSMETEKALFEERVLKQVMDKVGSVSKPASQQSNQATPVVEGRLNQLEQSVSMIAASLETSILGKISELLTTNVEQIIPSIGILRRDFDHFKSEIEDKEAEAMKSASNVKDVDMQLSALKKEFDYIKNRFNPAFVQRIDKTLSSLSTMAYDIEVVKMSTANAAMKKDLDMLDQRFSTYVPLGKFLDLQRKTEHFALKSEMKLLEEEVEQINKNFTRVALRIDVNEKIEIVQEQIMKFIDKKVDTEEWWASVEDNGKKISKVNKALKKTLAGLSEEVNITKRRTEENNRSIHETRKGLDECMKRDDGRDIMKHFERFAIYEDLIELKKMVMPPIAQFEDKLQKFADLQVRTQEMVRQFDENICNKANKDQVKNLYTTIEEKFATKAASDHFMVVTDSQIEAQTTRMKELETLVKFQSKQVMKEMHGAVRRAMQQKEAKEIDQPADMGEVVTTIKEIMSKKAEKDAIDELLMSKANKVDTEMTLRWTDLLHKMVNQIMLLLTMKFKLDLDPTQDNETQNTQKNKRVQLLHQSLIVSKWVESFDSQNINDFYFKEEKDRDPREIHKVQMQFVDSLQEMQQTDLSPNLVTLNKHLSATKERLNLGGTHRKSPERNSPKFMQATMRSSPNRLMANGSMTMLSDQGGVQSGQMSPRDGSLESKDVSQINDASKFKKIAPALQQRARNNRSVDPHSKQAKLLGFHNSNALTNMSPGAVQNHEASMSAFRGQKTIYNKKASMATINGSTVKRQNDITQIDNQFKVPMSSMLTKGQHRRMSNNPTLKLKEFQTEAKATKTIVFEKEGPGTPSAMERRASSTMRNAAANIKLTKAQSKLSGIREGQVSNLFIDTMKDARVEEQGEIQSARNTKSFNLPDIQPFYQKP